MTARALTIGFATTLILAFCLAILTGTIEISPARIGWAAIGMGDPLAHVVLFDVRLPRAVAAALAGAALGMSGAALQSLLRNPLAEPGTLGVSATSALAATTVVYFGLASQLPWLVPLAAMAGALLAGLLILMAGVRQRGVASLILVGVALSALSGAVMALFVNLAPNPFSLSDLINWTAGSVANRDWSDIAFATPFIIIGCAILWLSRRSQMAMLFGEESAHAMGVDLYRTRLMVVIGTACATGGAVAVAGMIGFVGLIAPHLCRMIGGPAVQDRIVPSGLCAATILLLADTIIRTLPGLNELHLGTLAALVGAPLFALIAMRAGSMRHG